MKDLWIRWIKESFLFGAVYAVLHLAVDKKRSGRFNPVSVAGAMVGHVLAERIVYELERRRE